MSTCQHCGAGLDAAAGFCPSCGQPTSSVSEMMTADLGAVPAPAPAADVAGFPPGAVLAGRYRVVALLGRGGMGEVYRADDLKLGHPVALKFLPAAMGRDPQARERFHAEVRNARQVSHPSVCRVYDVGEIEGRLFLTMEFVDGEDLASLLRRIGRLPPDKALEIARQICAGMAAAHERGMIHRDLKPANIMLDGRGKARITDFGLAVTTAESDAEFAGTPAYMSPEQLAGQPATQQSDIYAIGLVLYELFSGKRVFENTSVPELQRQRRGSSPRLPSSFTTDVDPAVEGAILRCLAEDPKQRPSSAMQLAMALPGGDPLMAAIAAGETPSPELIAAAGGEEAGIEPRAAALLLVVIVLALATLVPLARKASVFGLAPSVKSPEALADRAQEIAKSLGYVEAPRDHAWMMLPSVQLKYSAIHDPSPARYRNLDTAEPGPHRFAYLQSPDALRAPSPLGGVNAFSQPRDTPGMVAVALDGHGHLMTFTALPPLVIPERSAEMDWSRLLSHTSLDLASLKPVPPRELFPFAHDQRAEWTGTWEGGPVQVSAASLGGRPVSLRITGIWGQRGTGVALSRMLEWIVIVFVFVFFGVGPVVAGMMARHNLKLGRSDRRGALRLATFVGACNAIALLSVGGYQLEARLVVQIASRLGIAVLTASVVWVSYMALEPLIRRRTPELLVSWMRLLDGRWRDPRVGRDVLIGLCAGTVLPVIAYGLVALPWWINAPGVVPLHQLFAINDWAATALLLIGATPVFSLAILFLLALIQGIFKRSWVLLLALFLINLAGTLVDQHLNLPFILFYSTVSTAATFFLITRVGPLALSVATMACLLLWTNPLDFHGGAWYWPQSAAILIFIGGLGVLAFRSALGGRHLVGNLLED